MNTLYHKVAVASVCTALGFALGSPKEAKAATLNLPPTINFQVTDWATNGHSFDGLGDQVYSGGFFVTNKAGVEVAALKEFNISNFSLAPNIVISSAVFKTKISTSLLDNLGGDGYFSNPGSLGIFGYVGNGTAEPSDFEAGVLLSSVDISSLSLADSYDFDINFDVTSFVNQRVNNADAFAGFAIRALNFGTLAVGDPNKIGFSSLVIETADVAEPVPEPTTIFGSAIALSVGGWLKRKKFSQQNKITP